MFDTTHYEDKVPERLLVGLIAWGKQHHPVGDFLTAVLKNDLFEAVARADYHSIVALKWIVMFVHNELPGKCHGSPEHVKKWIEQMEATVE